MASHHTLHENCMVGQAIGVVSVASATATNGLGINVATLGGQRVSFIVNCGNLASTDLFTFTFQESATDSSYTNIKNTEATSVNVTFSGGDGTASDNTSSIMTIPYSVLASTTKYVRIVATSSVLSGSWTATLIGVSYVITGHNTVPTAQADLTYNQCVSYA